jgi:hypothetical protein
VSEVSKEDITRNLQRALLVLVLAQVCSHVALAQNNEALSSGSGGAYDASVCNDPTIAINAQQQSATPYRDATPTGQPDPLLAALYDLAQKYDNSNIDEASVCLHASGVVFMVPTNRVGELTQLLGEIEASEPGGDTYNASDKNGSGGQPGGTPAVGGGTPPSGGPSASAINVNPCEPNYDMNNPAGRAAAVQNAPQTKYACCVYLRAHNPDLAPCTPLLVAQAPPNYEPWKPLTSSLTESRLHGKGQTSVPGKKNGKTVTMPVPLNFDIGKKFPRTGIGYVDPDPVWNNATGDEPDPYVVLVHGSLNKTETVFTVTSIDFTSLAQKTYGVGKSYAFPAGKQPMVNLSEYQANVK